MEKERRKIPVKYLVVLILAAVCLVTYLFDFVRSKTYYVDVVYVSDDTPVASNAEDVVIRVRVTRFGQPMANHDMFALPDAGTMKSYTATTDENGYAEFIYHPYTANKFMQLTDVVITIRDESNSLIWEVNSNVNVRLSPVKEA